MGTGVAEAIHIPRRHGQVVDERNPGNPVAKGVPRARRLSFPNTRDAIGIKVQEARQGD